MSRPRCGKPTSNGPCGKAEGHTPHCTSADAMTRMRDAEYARRRPKPRLARAVWAGNAMGAALTLADRATSTADCRTLLEACGLLPYQRGQHRTYAYGRQS